jgi:hypothetical protein
MTHVLTVRFQENRESILQHEYQDMTTTVLRSYHHTKGACCSAVAEHLQLCAAYAHQQRTVIVLAMS